MTGSGNLALHLANLALLNSSLSLAMSCTDSKKEGFREGVEGCSMPAGCGSSCAEGVPLLATVVGAAPLWLVRSYSITMSWLG